MRLRVSGAVLVFTVVCLPLSALGGEVFRNEKVLVSEFSLKPGETLRVDGRHSSLTVYFDSGSMEFLSRDGRREKLGIKRGDVAFAAAQAGDISNTGTAAMKFVRTEFLTEGDAATWGVAGLSPNYRLLIENRYTRAYEIRISAGSREPQHTHKARVVICLSGATLKHLMPDGREESSTLKTGEVVWREGGTHIGQNLGATDLWVIAVEPK